MRIGAVAEEVGVSAKTIRYYESIGLLPEPERTPAGYRDYPPGTVERLGFVRSSVSAGLTLREIASILALKDAGESSCTHTRALLEQRLRALDGQIHALQEARRELADLAERAAAMDPSTCTDPNACQILDR